jgi:hypothetical protein
VQTVRGVAREPGRAGRELDQRHLVRDDGVAQPQIERTELFFGIGAEQDDDATLGARVVDGGPRQREQQLGGRPSPSWQSTLSVPITP